MRLILGLFLFFCSCTKPSLWQYEHILSQDPKFSSKRLKYIGRNSPLEIELYRMDEKTDLFLSLGPYEIDTDQNKETEVLFTIQGKTFSEKILPHKGNMRLLISPKSLKQLVEAWERGESATLSLNENEEKIEPEMFSKYYAKFRRHEILVETLIEELFQ